MKGVLFDLDGVITRTDTLHSAAWSRLIKDNFKINVDKETLERTKGISRQDSLTLLLDELDIDISDERFNQLANEKNHYYQSSLESLNSDDILPGIDDLLSNLHVENIKVALASASHNGPRILTQLGIENQFDAVVDPAKIANGKPAPDIYIAAAKSINCEASDCIGIEDSSAGVVAINDSGAVSIGVGSDSEIAGPNAHVDSTSELNLTFLNQVWDKQQA